MSGFVDKLKLKEQAEEDIFFARRDRELLASRHPSHAEPIPGIGLRILSGGQTGVDRAALDAALASGLPIGGWCPLGRRAEDAVIPPIYPLRETPSRDYAQRTEWNVRDSDATLILHPGTLSGGTRLTAELARRAGRPLLIRDLSTPLDTDAVVGWLSANQVKILNCAGPRESGAPGIQARALDCLTRLFTAWIERCGRAG